MMATQTAASSASANATGLWPQPGCQNTTTTGSNFSSESKTMYSFGYIKYPGIDTWLAGLDTWYSSQTWSHFCILAVIFQSPSIKHIWYNALIFPIMYDQAGQALIYCDAIWWPGCCDISFLVKLIFMCQINSIWKNTHFNTIGKTYQCFIIMYRYSSSLGCLSWLVDQILVSLQSIIEWPSAKDALCRQPVECDGLSLSNNFKIHRRLIFMVIYKVQRSTRMWSGKGSTQIYSSLNIGKKGARYLKISHKQKSVWPPLPRTQSPQTVQSHGGKVIKWIPGSFTPCNSASHQQLNSGKASRQTRARLWINDLPESAEAHLDWFHGLASAQSESECTYAELILIPNWPISQHAPSTWAGEQLANTEWQSAQPKNGSWLGDALIDSQLLKWLRHWGELRSVKIT